MKSLVVGGIVAILVLAFVSVAAAQTDTTAASAEIRDVQGRVVGNALLTQQGTGPVRVQVQVAGFDPGEAEHGIHFHAVEACTPNFEAAGPHFNPASKQHGLANPNGPHAGDLPNFRFSPDGSGTYDNTTDRITLGQGPNSVFDADGTAIVIHAGSDDQVTDPTGNSGDRIACGVLVSGRGAAGPVGAPTSAATGSPTAAATATGAAQATPAATAAATAAATSAATAEATAGATAGATPEATTTATTSEAPATLPTTGGGSGLLLTLLVLGAALAAGGGIARLARK